MLGIEGPPRVGYKASRVLIRLAGDVNCSSKAGTRHVRDVELKFSLVGLSKYRQTGKPQQKYVPFQKLDLT